MKKKKIRTKTESKPFADLFQLSVLFLFGVSIFSVAVNFWDSTILKPLFNSVISGIVFCIILFKGNLIIPLKPHTFFIIGYILWNIISIFFSPFHYDNFLGLNLLLTGITLFFIIISIPKWNNEIFIKTLVIFAVIQASYAIFQRLGYSPFLWDQSARMRHLKQFGSFDNFRSIATFGHSNYLGSFLGFSIPLILYNIFSKKRNLWFYFSVFALLVVIFGLAFTLSRGAWIAAFVGSFVFFLFLISMHILKTKKFFYLMIFLLSLLILLSVVMPDIFTQRLQSVFSPAKAIDLGRKNIWAGSLRMFLAKPLGGWGVGTFRQIFPKFRSSDYKLYAEDIVEHAHNEYMEILVESGIIGLLLFGGILISVFGNFLLNKKNDLALVAIFSGLCGLLVQNLVSITLRTPTINLIFWASLACLVRTNINGQARLTSKKRLFALALFSPIMLFFIIFNSKNAISDYELGRGINDTVIGRQLFTNKQHQEWEKYLRKAERKLEKAITYNAYNKLAYYKLGIIYMDTKKYEQAIFTFERLLKIAPYYPEAKKTLGLAYSEDGETKKAIENLSLSLKNTVDADTYFALARLYEKTDVLDSTLYYYESFISLASKKMSRINALQGYSDYKKQQRRKLGMQLSEAYAKLQEKYTAFDKWDRAIKPYKEAVSGDGNESFFHYNLGVAFRKNGDYENAVISQKRAIELAKHKSIRTKALNELYECYISLNRPKLAQKIYSELKVDN